MSSPLPDKYDQLEFVCRLGDMGVTVFASQPRKDQSAGEYWHPTDWSALTPASNLLELKRWKPGHAMRVLGGDIVAIIDVDTKEPYKADPEAVRALLADLGVRIFAEIQTPSGGRHFYVAGHPDMPTVHAVTGWPGVEVLGHGGNVYAPGTRRPRYGGAGYTVLWEDLDALAEGDVDGAEALVGWLADNRSDPAGTAAEGKARSTAPPAEPGSVPWDKRSQAFIAGLLRHEVEFLQKMGPDSGRNNRAFSAARNIAERIAAMAISDEVWDAEFTNIRAALLAACEVNGLCKSEGPASVQATISSGFRRGVAQPRGLPEEPAVGPPGRENGYVGRELRLTSASALDATSASWLWDERVAEGTLSLFGGREALGKSTVVYALVALLTRGELPGARHGRPSDVLIAATEDAWPQVVIPRLMAAGADLTRIHLIDVVTPLGDDELSLPDDIEQVGQAARELDAALLVLDPLMSRLSAQLDTHRDADVRRALEPMTKMLADTGMSCIGLIHVNKSGSTDPMTALMGSRAFGAVARSVTVAVADPDDDEGRQRLLGTVKNNLGRTDLPLLSYRIVGSDVLSRHGEIVSTSRVEWTGERNDMNVSDVMEAAANAGDRMATREAADWLTDYLSSEGGAADSAAVKKAGAGAGHAERTLQRALRRIGGSVSSTGFPRRTIWHLPEDAPRGS